jgi:predicted ATPase with chaperone activity
MTMVSRYQKRISGPLLDHIDIHVEVLRVDYEKLSSDRLGEPSQDVRPQVEAARERQRARFEGTSLSCNADMGPAEIRQYCQVDEAARSLRSPARKCSLVHDWMQTPMRAYPRNPSSMSAPLMLFNRPGLVQTRELLVANSH